MSDFIKAFIETTDAQQLKALRPVLKTVKNYKGTLNSSFRNRNATDGVNYDQWDNFHKSTLRAKIAAVLPPGFILGTGGSHIWIASHTATNIEWDKKENKFVGLPVAINGPHDRVLLIADHDSV